MPNSPAAPPEPSDESLVERLIQRDVDAFSALYDRYARAVYALAVYMVSAAEAEEVTQEVFTRLWNKAHQFDPARGTFAGWFMTIVRNHLRDRLRDRRHEQQIIAAEEIHHLLAEIPDPTTNIEEDTWLRSQGEAVLRALQTLPEEQRRALVLAYFGGLSQSSIAEQLEWPLGTVKKRIRLGLQKLRAFLASEETEVQEPTELGSHHEV
jgi:RNA polymerase sigma-70 factor (ECF subfamily)